MSPVAVYLCRSGRSKYTRTRCHSVTAGGRGVAVWNSWGASEGGGLGIPCDAGPWTHIADDLFIVEPVDAAGNPTPPGERSAKIYLTNLYNRPCR